MTDPNMPNNGSWHPAEPGVPTWAPPGQGDLIGPPPGTVPGAPMPTAPDPWARVPSIPPPPADCAQPAVSGAPVEPQWAPPTAPPAWTALPPGTPVAPPPTAAYNPVPAPGSPYGRRHRRRGGMRGNGIYPVVAGVISLLVALISLAVGHVTFLVVLPIFGLIYGIVSITQANRRVLGIIGTVLCGLALILEAALFVG